MSEHLDIMSEPILYDIFNANCVEDIEMYKELCSNVFCYQLTIKRALFFPFVNL
jgi:hypothetical protein